MNLKLVLGFDSSSGGRFWSLMLIKCVPLLDVKDATMPNVVMLWRHKSLAGKDNIAVAPTTMYYYQQAE